MINSRKDALTMHSTHFIYGYMSSDMGYSFRLAAMVLLYASSYRPVMDHWLEWDIAQWVYHEGSIQRPIAPWANALTTELHLSPINSSVIYVCLCKTFNDWKPYL